MEAGRNVDIASHLLQSMDVPYIVASPLLLQSIPMWKSNGVLGLQSVVLYSLPELDGAIDTVVLGGLVGDKIALVPERVRKLCSRLKGWIGIRKTPHSQRKISIMIYGFPPNVGAVGTAGESRTMLFILSTILSTSNRALSFLRQLCWMFRILWTIFLKDCTKKATMSGISRPIQMLPVSRWWQHFPYCAKIL